MARPKHIAVFLLCLCVLTPGLTAIADQSDTTARVISLVRELKIQILSQNQFKHNGLNLNVLVPPSTTKEKALHISNRIRDTFPGYVLDVAIFDSREAYKNRLNDRYPEKKYFRHYLIQMNQNPHTGFSETKWMAKGRRH